MKHFKAFLIRMFPGMGYRRKENHKYSAEYLSDLIYKKYYMPRNSLLFPISEYESIIKDLAPEDAFRRMAYRLGELYLAHLESNAPQDTNDCAAGGEA